MKGLPFNEEMALAVWEKRKSVTRRPMKPQPDTSHWKPQAINKPKEWRKQAYLGPQHMSYDLNMWCLFNVGDSYGAVPYTGRKPPYSPGEVVYMQEPLNWESYASNGITDLCYVSDGTEVDAESPDTWNPPTNSVMSHWESGDNIPGGGFSWCNGTVQSIFMPQWASRLHLRLTVRPERLWEITEEEAVAEGILVGLSPFNPDSAMQYPELLELFADLWDSIYGKTFPWSSNPWVWRYGLEEVWRR